MPPKAKFTKAEIIEAALNIVRADGYEALTSRALGTYLGSSARPIFTVFKNMEEVQQDMIKSAKALYKEYVNKGLTTEPPFKGVGTQYILFAVNEPKLFQLLFMTEQKQIPDLSGVLPLIGIIELVYIVLQSVVKPGITGFFKIDLYIKCYIYLS